MKIVYKQSNNDANSSLSRFGVEKCYFKQLSFERDNDNITKKRHHHTDFELHIITNGFREYMIGDTLYKVTKNDFLLIFPKTPHIALSSSPDFQEVSITFSKETPIKKDVFPGKLTKRILSNLSFISDEALIKKEISSTLIENVVLEILVFTFRLMGLKENKSNFNADENHMISMAKQYIEDNIDTNPTVSDISKYCHLSIKQLTRIFLRSENTSPGKYIIGRRVARIEKLLTKQTSSIKDISEIMHFNNEYYFNTFFKKYSGMPPGEYRKMFCANMPNEKK